MRLEKIKLAGFKSFVDPTTVPFPSNLVGVVGPNGCGKSNVIDAVRWVMGESSAKMLRGESMADVIFNGSNSRKPVGTASIELLFDNSDGGAGGQYSQYSHISVKRQVSRDGQSNYSLNGVRCRRRDITDLFLGTGLGPRSYSIIEQGMISRIIESKPEELRVYLEEAAGISKYKERRRETENRIRHTRENLDRLNDLMDEVQKQLRHLERQAATAEKYKELKQRERRVNAELLALRLAQLDSDIENKQRQIAERGNRFESAVADQRRVEAEIEKDREQHSEANEEFNGIQGQFYAVGADIARLEEAIQYTRESRRQQQADLEQVEKTLSQAEGLQQHDEVRLQELAEELERDQPGLDAARKQVEATGSKRAEAETAMQNWQTEWDDFNHRATEPAQRAQVERTRINHLEQQENQLKQRTERLAREREQLSDARLQAEIGEAERKESENLHELERLQKNAKNAAEKISSERSVISARQQALTETRSELETVKGRLASLQALQQAALGEDDEDLSNWLGQAGLDKARRLLEKIDVDARWQSAVEVVLGSHLQSICVDDVSSLKESIQNFTSGHLELFETAAAEVSNAPGTLAEVVRGPDQVRSLLSTVHMVADLAEALNQRASLRAGESVVTPEGIWLGAGWLRYYQGEGAQAGMLAREQEIRELTERQQKLDSRAEQLATELTAGQQGLAEAESIRDESQRALDAANRTLSDLRAQLSAKRARAEHIRQRIETLDKEVAEIREQIRQGTVQMEASRKQLHEALELIETLSAQREQFVARRERLQQELAEARERASAANNAAHEIALRVESMRSSEQSLRTGIERINSQLEQLKNRCNSLREALAASEQPLQVQRHELEQKLAARIQVESKLSEARKKLERIDHQLRELEQQRHINEQRVQERREKLDQARLAKQEVVVRGQTLVEQQQESGFERKLLDTEMPEEASVSVWQEKSQKLANRIQRLGPINLAAIDEFKEQTERMEYLERQNKDVRDALETLENAIHKIDRETRTRFKETFDKVNSGLQTMFPKLFGGGHAYLELTGEDLLDAGVAIMARPPGKRNSSIHLLSGGEKALSAVALVFSIFQLNPAPFCMLDEVDAPLDDANVGRFCNLVKEMSEKVQFIFITHNKVTMEIANQLTGVTMSEPGVSRLVSVDVDAAAQMAAV